MAAHLSKWMTVHKSRYNNSTQQAPQAFVIIIPIYSILSTTENSLTSNFLFFNLSLKNVILNFIMKGCVSKYTKHTNERYKFKQMGEKFLNFDD